MSVQGSNLVHLKVVGVDAFVRVIKGRKVYPLTHVYYYYSTITPEANMTIDGDVDHLVP